MNKISGLIFHEFTSKNDYFLDKADLAPYLQPPKSPMVNGYSEYYLTSLRSCGKKFEKETALIFDLFRKIEKGDIQSIPGLLNKVAGLEKETAIIIFFKAYDLIVFLAKDSKDNPLLTQLEMVIYSRLTKIVSSKKDLKVLNLFLASEQSLISKYAAPLAAIAAAGAFFVHSGLSLNLAAGALCTAGAAHSFKKYQLKKDRGSLVKLALCIAGLAAALLLRPYKYADLNDKCPDLNDIPNYRKNKIEEAKKNCVKGFDCDIRNAKIKTLTAQKYFNNLLTHKYGIPSKDVVSSMCISRGNRFPTDEIRLDCFANLKKQTFDTLNSDDDSVTDDYLSSIVHKRGITELWMHGYIDLNNRKYVTQYENAIGQNLYLQIHLFSNFGAYKKAPEGYK